MSLPGSIIERTLLASYISVTPKALRMIFGPTQRTGRKHFGEQTKSLGRKCSPLFNASETSGNAKANWDERLNSFERN
jgi:hypothetical protein